MFWILKNRLKSIRNINIFAQLQDKTKPRTRSIEYVIVRTNLNYLHFKMLLCTCTCLLKKKSVKRINTAMHRTRIPRCSQFNSLYRKYSTIIGPYTIFNQACTHPNVKCVRRNRPALVSLGLSLLSLNWSGAWRASGDIIGGYFNCFLSKDFIQFSNTVYITRFISKLQN